MKRESTSEEKLLQLIRRKSTSKIISKAAEQKSLNESSLTQEKDSLTWDEKSLAGFLGMGTRILAIISFGFVVFSVAQIFFIKDTRVIPALEQEVREAANETEQFILPPQIAFNSYAEELSKRDLFSHSGSASASEGADGAVAPAVLRDLSSEYQLVGILLDKDPTAVIENRQTGRTLFLPQGGILDDGIVEQIEEGRVIVNFSGQRLELRQ